MKRSPRPSILFTALFLLLALSIATVGSAAEITVYVQNGMVAMPQARRLVLAPLTDEGPVVLFTNDEMFRIRDTNKKLIYFDRARADGLVVGSGFCDVTLPDIWGNTPVTFTSDCSLQALSVYADCPVVIQGNVDLLYVNAAASVTVQGTVNFLYVTNANASVTCSGSINYLYPADGVSVSGAQVTEWLGADKVYAADMTYKKFH